MSNRSVTFETKVWENDWELILKTSRIADAIERCDFPFSDKKVFINNVRNRKLVETAAQKLVDNGTIDSFVFVDDFAKQALSHFQITQDQLGKGYVYSISELVSIFTCTSEYLLHFSGDSIPEKSLQKNWLLKGIDCLENNPSTKVFNLTWNNKYQQARQGSFSEDEHFYYGFGFSDQMYLIRTAEFCQPIYNQQNETSNRYPAYGGELFEKRVDAWMRNNGHGRATLKSGSYWHVNFSKNKFLRKIGCSLNLPNFPRR